MAADLELVIRAQDAATAVLQRVSAQVKTLGDDTSRDMARATSATTANTSSINALSGAIAATGGFALLKSGLGAAVESSNNLQSALIGLASVARGFGHDAGEAQQVALNLSANGLIPVTESATALKNLLASGFSIQESTQLLDALANKAAFNRQSFYDLGGAVVATTEGIKNGNSVLADATGTTTNLSVMAQQAGISQQEMGNAVNNAALRQAYFNGFMRDSATSMGDLDKLSKTTAGSQAQFGFAVNQTSARLGQLVSVGLQPVLRAATQFLQANQSMVVSAAVAGAAMLAFGVAIIGTAAAIGIAVAVIGGPLTIALMAVAALIGVVVYGAAQRLQTQMGSMFKGFTDGAKGMSNAANQDMGAASKKAQELAQKLSDISEAVQKANRDFGQSLADILKTSQDKISDLSRQIKDETSTFQQAQQDRTDSFNQSMADQKLQHERKVSDIEKDLDRETLKGRFADQSRIADLRERLDQENADYAKSTADKQAQYDKDTTAAKAQNDKQLGDLQTKLAAENAFLSKHAADLQGIRAADALDEIDRLKQSHNDQMVEFNKQRDRAITSAQQTTGGMAAAFNGLPGMVNGGAFSGLGKTLGKDMGKALQDAFMDSFNSLMGSIGNYALSRLKSLATSPTGSGLVLSDIGGLLKTLKVPGFASGVRGFSGGAALVGEHGPELVNLPRGTDVYSNPETRQIASGSGGVTVHQTNYISRDVDMDMAMRDLAWRLQRA